MRRKVMPSWRRGPRGSGRPWISSLPVLTLAAASPHLTTLVLFSCTSLQTFAGLGCVATGQGSLSHICLQHASWLPQKVLRCRYGRAAGPGRGELDNSSCARSSAGSHSQPGRAGQAHCQQHDGRDAQRLAAGGRGRPAEHFLEGGSANADPLAALLSLAAERGACQDRLAIAEVQVPISVLLCP